MRTYRVLVVDDELVTGSMPRQEIYENLCSKINGLETKSMRFDFTYKDSEASLLHLLNTQIFDIAIVDLILTGSDKSEFTYNGVEEVFEKIFQRCDRVFLTTRRFDEAQISTIVKAAKKSHFYGLFPFTIIENRAKEFAALVSRCVLDRDPSEIFEFVQSKVETNSDFNVLFVSDLHVGEEDTRADEIELSNIYNKLNIHLGDNVRPDIIFILGDCIEKGNYDASSNSVEFIRKMCSLFRMPRLPNPFVNCIPGNHDCLVPVSLSAFVEKLPADEVPKENRVKNEWIVSDDGVQKSLLDFGLSYFKREIVSRVYQADKYLDISNGIESELNWVDTRFLGIGFCLVGLNTNQYPGPSKMVEGGLDVNISTALQREFDDISREEKENAVLIVATHHSTFDRSVEGYVELHTIAHNAGFKGVVFASGHEHSDSFVRPAPSPSNNTDKQCLEVHVATLRQGNVAREENASQGMLLLSFGDSDDNIAAKSRRFKIGAKKEISVDSSQFHLGSNGWQRSN